MAMDQLGVPPVYWTQLAIDDLWTVLRDYFAASGISSGLLVTDEDARTTVALVTHEAGGGPSFDFYRQRGADTRL